MRPSAPTSYLRRPSARGRTAVLAAALTIAACALAGAEQSGAANAPKGSLTTFVSRLKAEAVEEKIKLSWISWQTSYSQSCRLAHN